MPSHASSERELLHLIKASAGSGKTHRLTGEYLRLLFSRPNNHTHILAVTFTNKATDEMKSRIVVELHRLASGKPSSYLECLMQEFTMSESRIRGLSRGILETILHDYSAFNISTIDRFFQRTMRAFTREIGLAGGYNIEVEESTMLMEAVDLMLSELDKPENSTLSDWLLRYMQESIEEGQNWKIESQVYELAAQLTNETYKSLTAEEFAVIQDKEFLETYRQMLMRIIRSYENELKKVGVKAVSIIQKHGLQPSDFVGGSRSQFFKLEQIARGELPNLPNTFFSFPDHLEGWSTKKTQPEIASKIADAYHNGLNDSIKEVITRYSENLTYNTAKVILQNFYTLGILSDIKNRLRSLQQENNTLFLSDTTELLNHIIAGTDAPFIFEKTGTLLTHYMIDEFQDTSRMQWQNFMPLLRESLASGNFNLIVGDVKQSIYRWRNSDWRLLEETVEEELHSENIRSHLLDTNWRSDAHIVRFNNAFFTNAAALLQEEVNRLMTENENPIPETSPNTQIRDAYAEVYQELPPHKKDSGGQVKITFLTEDEDQSWKEKALEQLPHEIESLQDQGFALKEIAILVRTNKEAVEVADRLLTYADQHPGGHYRYDIISNEALLIGKAQAVKAVIALMRHFQQPNDPTRRMLAIYEYERFRRHIAPEEAIKSYTEHSGEFPPELQAQIRALATLPFYEMIETFFSQTANALDEKENAHLQAFLDIALRFSTSRSGDLNSFLEWWDEKGHKKALFSPDNQDAIRLITIHKSKGLGFGAVIMPFLSWDTDHGSGKNHIIWCKPREAPFDKLRIAPLRYGKRLTETIFREDYLEERRFTYIDNLNMLYVAFTRAKHRLIAYAPLPLKPEKISNVSDLLWRSITSAPGPSQEEMKELVDLRNYFSEEKNCLLYGDTKSVSKKESEEMIVTKTGQWHAIPIDNRLRMRLNGIGYFTDDGSRDYGTLMHAIVSNVITMADLPQAVEHKISEGELPEQERDEIVNKLRGMLSHPAVAEWYSGKYTVLNERELLHPEWGFRRPDRVMIGSDEVIVAEYKFGELEEPKHLRQVEHYVRTIREMGFNKVTGYLFYMKTGKLIRV